MAVTVQVGFFDPCREKSNQLTFLNRPRPSIPIKPIAITTKGAGAATDVPGPVMPTWLMIPMLVSETPDPKSAKLTKAHCKLAKERARNNLNKKAIKAV